MHELKISSLSEINNAAAKFIELTANRRIFAFIGNMGAGKTTFIKAVCRILGVNDNSASPTFSIVNEYLSEQNGLIYHFDFYRIKSINELHDIGFEEYFSGNPYIFVEWPEKAPDLLPDETIYIIIENSETGERILKW